ncbi:MAG TPA: DUF3617 family protein, partial [Hyphomicrobiaceae bacterium]|nr:DUF3617 family protein [Hyphomicrobiaceae bacterium]
PRLTGRKKRPIGSAPTTAAREGEVKREVLALALIGLAPASPAPAVDAGALEPGRYEVSVRLDLPNIEGAAAARVLSLCVPAQDGVGTHGLMALSENNPFSHCPVFNVHQQGSTLSFEIVCPGGNAAMASASYRLAGTAFDGRIAMKLGGKNMTLTETQTGRRIGECQP